MPKAMIVIKTIVFTGVSIAYFIIKGNELAYAIYLPLDIILEACLLIYRIGEAYLERIR